MWGVLRGASLFKVKNMAIPVSFEQVTANSVDGAQMGKGVLEKNGFFGSTPVIQPTSGDQAAVSATAAAASTTQAAVTDSLDGATFIGTALTTSSTPTVDELETAFGVVGLQLNAARTDIAAQKVELDKLITDVASLITLGNQVRSELVTLGLIKGS